MKLGKKVFFSLQLGPIFGPKKRSRKITAITLNPFSELLPNLYYSPIKKSKNIFIIKITRQQRPYDLKIIKPYISTFARTASFWSNLLQVRSKQSQIIINSFASNKTKGPKQDCPRPDKDTYA